MRRAASCLAFLALLVGLALTSNLRTVGDGEEYLRLAERLGQFTAPGGVSRHFWLYSALAAPFVRLAAAIGSNPLAGFTVLNVGLLVWAFAVVLPRVGSAGTWLLMAGPILWWTDKAHTEPFTFATVAVGFALLAEAPWWAFVALALAGMQNVPIALALPAAVLASLARRPAWRTDRRWWTGLVAAALLLLVVLGYNLAHYGAPLPLLDRPRLQMPLLLDLFVPLFDPNLGLVPNFVTLPVVLVVVAAALLRKQPRVLFAPEVAAAAFALAAFLFGASQAANVNHGGTPVMSRYAMWLLPLSVPLLARAHDSLGAGARRWLAPVAVLSVGWSLVAFRPAVPERIGEPTPLARYLWTRHPSFDNPNPEIFVERLHGVDDDWAPAATGGCEKVLLVGRGSSTGSWPLPCPPAPMPDACREPGRLCYANKADRGYTFVRLPPRGDRFRFRREDTWSIGVEPRAAALFARLGWRGLSEASLVESSRGVRLVKGLESPSGAIVCLRDLEAGAVLGVRSRVPAVGSFIDPHTGSRVADVSILPGTTEVRPPSPAGDLVLDITFRSTVR
jgi:hypothetical protein